MNLGCYGSYTLQGVSQFRAVPVLYSIQTVYLKLVLLARHWGAVTSTSLTKVESNLLGYIVWTLRRMDGWSRCFTTFIKLICLRLRDAAYPFQITGSPRYTSLEHRGLIQGEVLLNKLEEVSKSVKVWTLYFLYAVLSNADKQDSFMYF